MKRRTFLGAMGTGFAGLSVRIPGPGRGIWAADRLAPFDPWIEVDAAALRANVARVSGLAGGRPILAVVKNNAYGLGLREAVGVLAPLVHGFAVVKPTSALLLREWGVTHPILLMGIADHETTVELASAGVGVSFYVDDAAERARRVFEVTRRPLMGEVYLDTGMGRMGIAAHRAVPWLRDLAASGHVEVRGTFMAFTEAQDFDPEQLARFQSYASEARSGGLPVGQLHAASSNGVYHLPSAHLDMVRPGIALFGAYPSRPEEEHAKQPLTCAVRLCARVVRVQRLRPGDGVSYGRSYVAERPTWTATLPVGHTDGYPRGAVNGARVLIGGRTYPVIGAVSASHCIVEVGEEPTVAVGDRAVLLGSDDPAIEPNTLAEKSESSVYDVLMHLNPTMPRLIV